jgi:hypothetical protein
MALKQKNDPTMFSFYVFATDAPDFNTYDEEGEIQLGFVENAQTHMDAVEAYKRLYEGDLPNALEYAAIRADHVAFFTEDPDEQE